jgi:hypothetical protein
MNIPIRIFLLALTLFIFKNIGYAQVPKLDSVKVEFQGFHTETFYDVSCEAFDETFDDTRRIQTFYKQDDLSKFSTFKQYFKLQKKHSIDVRGAIVFYYKKRSIKYCFDLVGRFYKDEKFYYNKKLLIYISDKLYTNHPKYLDKLREHE